MEEKSTLQEALDFLRSREKCNLLMVMTNIIVFVILEWMGSTTDTMLSLIHIYQRYSASEWKGSTSEVFQRCHCTQAGVCNRRP